VPAVPVQDIAWQVDSHGVGAVALAPKLLVSELIAVAKAPVGAAGHDVGAAEGADPYAPRQQGLGAEGGWPDGGAPVMDWHRPTSGAIAGLAWMLFMMDDISGIVPAPGAVLIILKIVQLTGGSIIVPG